MPAISTQFFSCTSPHLPRVCGWRRALTRVPVCVPRSPSPAFISSSRVRTASSALPRSRLRVVTSFSIRSRFLPIGSVRRRNSASRFGLLGVDLARLLVDAQQVGYGLRGRLLDRRAVIDRRRLLGPPRDDVHECRDEGEDGYAEDDGHLPMVTDRADVAG